MEDATRKPTLPLHALALAALAFAAVLAFLPSLHGPFVLDDFSSVVRNPAIRHLGRGPGILASAGGTRGRPVATLSLAINYAAGSLTPEGYHAGNLLVHAAAALLLFGLVRRTLERLLVGDAGWIAFWAALIWAVHPIQAESVAYISQRTECLMGAFYLATLYGLLRGATSVGEGSRGRWYAFSVASCWLGMASKEVMVTAPVAALLFDRTFIAGSFRSAWTARGRLYLCMAGSWVMLALLLRGVSDRGAGVGLGVGPLAYAQVECGAILHYLRQAAWPDRLVFDMGAFGSVSGMASPAASLAVAALAAATLAALVARPVLGFLLAWVLLILSPTSSFVPIAYQPVAEHRMYLPLAALAVALSLILSAVPRRWSLLPLAAAASVLGLLSLQRSSLFATELSLWSSTVASDPASARAHANLGQAFSHLGRNGEAVRELGEAIRLDPAEPETRINLSVVLFNMGRVDEALRSVRTAIALAPRLPEAHYNLGWILAARGLPGQAESEYRQALTASPDFLDAHCNLADLLMKQGRFQEAASEYEEAVRLNPRDPSVQFNLGYTYVRLGQVGDALAHFRETLRIDPSFAAARRNIEILEQTRH